MIHKGPKKRERVLHDLEDCSEVTRVLRESNSYLMSGKLVLSRTGYPLTVPRVRLNWAKVSCSALSRVSIVGIVERIERVSIVFRIRVATSRVEMMPPTGDTIYHSSTPPSA